MGAEATCALSPFDHFFPNTFAAVQVGARMINKSTSWVNMLSSTSCRHPQLLWIIFLETSLYSSLEEKRENSQHFSPNITKYSIGERECTRECEEKTSCQVVQKCSTLYLTGEKYLPEKKKSIRKTFPLVSSVLVPWFFSLCLGYLYVSMCFIS